MDEHRLEHCLHYIIRLSFSRITTLTPSPLKTNLEFQSVGLLTGQSVGLDEEIGISSWEKIGGAFHSAPNSRNFAKKLNETDHFGSGRPEYLGPPTGQTIILSVPFNLANCCPQYHSSVSSFTITTTTTT